MQTPGLQLCEQMASSSYGATQCLWLFGGCQGSIDPSCYPYHLWSGIRASEGVYYLAELVGGTLSMTGACATGRCSSTYTGSVRCVLDLHIQ